MWRGFVADRRATMSPVGLVTGASRGIGRGIAVELARAGYDLIINYAASETMAEESRLAACAAGRPGLRVATFKADVSRASDREQLVAFARERFARIDLLVNNAGVGPSERVDLLDSTEESFDRVVAVNLKGAYFLTQAVARLMIEQSGGGQATDYPPAIINITSLSAYTASIDRGDYCISKAGLAMVTRLFAARLADHGIRVYEVRPGIISTDMTANVRSKYDELIESGLTPIRRWGTPEDVGRAVAALASGKLSFSTGDVINVDGGFHLRRL